MGKYGATKAEALAKLAEKLHDDEPFFVLRSTDLLAPDAVERYANELALAMGWRGNAVRCELQAFAARMRDWQARNPDKAKFPD